MTAFCLPSCLATEIYAVARNGLYVASASSPGRIPAEHGRSIQAQSVRTESAGRVFLLSRQLIDNVGQPQALNIRSARGPTLINALLKVCIMRQILVVQLWIIFLTLGISGAQAEDTQMRGACRADVKRFCKDVQPGGGRIAMCLKQHQAELSPGCRERMAEAKKERKQLADACQADAESLCKGEQHGQGRVMRCLAENKDKLSSACRAEMAEAQSRHPCMKDMERLCKGVQPGEGRMKECMKQNEADLSPECKAHRGGNTSGVRK